MPDWGDLYEGPLGGVLFVDAGMEPVTGIAVDIPPAKIRSATASLSGAIKLNFYLQLPDELLADSGAYVKFVYGENGEFSKKQLVSAAGKATQSDGEVWYRFSFQISAKMIGDEVRVRVYTGDDRLVKLTNASGTNDYTATGVSYSLMTYCSKMLNNSSAPAKLKAFLPKLVDYCTAVQILLDYNAEGLSVSDDVNAVDANLLEQYAATFGGSMPTGLTGRSIFLSVASNTSLRMRLTFADDADPTTFTYKIDGKKATLYHDDDGYYLQVSNIKPQDLDKLHVFSISKGSATYTIECSAMAYARSSVRSGVANRVAFGKAMYLYNEAAKAYFA
ncbi:MAG: hypothetical protein IJM07_01360 [Pyramidobacter sp.]|nr:hypothetical protein [Pyramidobacter sp.]